MSTKTEPRGKRAAGAGWHSAHGARSAGAAEPAADRPKAARGAIKPDDACPCGSGKTLATCCGPTIEGTAKAPTAEALMRARYTAFATGRPEFVDATIHPDQREDYDPESIARWSKGAAWHGLDVQSVEDGGENDDAGVVEFVARYTADGQPTFHHERATFRRHDGDWYLWDGELVTPTPVRRTEAKVGRNDLCPCGSGRKYKQCHGRLDEAS